MRQRFACASQIRVNFAGESIIVEINGSIFISDSEIGCSRRTASVDRNVLSAVRHGYVKISKCLAWRGDLTKRSGIFRFTSLWHGAMYMLSHLNCNGVCSRP